jgi:hypothetical protein
MHNIDRRTMFLLLGPILFTVLRKLTTTQSSFWEGMTVAIFMIIFVVRCSGEVRHRQTAAFAMMQIWALFVLLYSLPGLQLGFLFAALSMFMAVSGPSIGISELRHVHPAKNHAAERVYFVFATLLASQAVLGLIIMLAGSESLPSVFRPIESQIV